jgi:hypothetical protein
MTVILTKCTQNMMLASLEREGNFKITAQIRCFLKVKLKRGKKTKKNKNCKSMIFFVHNVFA